MKFQKSVFLGFLIGLCACQNDSLLNPSGSSLPPDGKLFAQITLQTEQDLSAIFLGGKDRTNEIEDVYEIQIDEVSAEVGNVSFETETAEAAVVFKNHEGHEHEEESESTTEDEEHSEPTSCDHEGSFASSQTVDLKGAVSLPCIVLDEGTYTSLKATVGSITVTGTAQWNGTAYPFEVRDEGQREIIISTEAPFALSVETHHIAVKIDVKNWFHGVDFSQLESVDGVVLFEVSHNTHRFEHMVEDHVPESLSLQIEE